MIRTRTGTWQLVGGAWEFLSQVITWCHCDTLQEAKTVRADILAGQSRDVLEAWIKERPPKLQPINN